MVLKCLFLRQNKMVFFKKAEHVYKWTNKCSINQFIDYSMLLHGLTKNKNDKKIFNRVFSGLITQLSSLILLERKRK